MTISQIRAMHRSAYRSDEWAIIVGVEIRKIGEPEELRLCFQVVFLDGATDSWMIFDPDAQYEIRNVEPGSAT